MKHSVNKVLDIALSETGYLEKKSDRQLEDKTANAGSGNYTKYGKELHLLAPDIMDYPAPWCDAFVDWCFFKAYGETEAKRLLGGSFNDYTSVSAAQYQEQGTWHTDYPQPGDQIFFRNNHRICHTGLVYHVDDSYVYTIEGNTSRKSGLVSNGGAFCLKKYRKSNPRITGYGRPNYDTPLRSEFFSHQQFIKELQSALGAQVDGIPGPETLSKTITVSKRKNQRHPAVRTLQKYFNSIGYSCGNEDGIAGNKFHQAVVAFQKVHGCIPDGELTARKKTWRKILKI